MIKKAAGLLGVGLLSLALSIGVSAAQTGGQQYSVADAPVSGSGTLTGTGTFGGTGTYKLKPDYLSTLSKGTYKLRIRFTDGSAETTFRIR